MKFHPFLLSVCLIGGLSACQSGSTFQVEGTVQSGDGQMLYLEQNALEGIQPIDSVKLPKDGTFKFRAQAPATPEFYRLRIGRSLIPFAIDSTETVRIRTEAPRFAEAYTIEGGESNLKIQELVKMQSRLQNDIDRIANEGTLLPGEKQDSIVSLIRNYKDHIRRDYIYRAPNQPYAYYALFQTINGYLIFDPLTDKDDVKAYAAVATSMLSQYPDAPRTKNLQNMALKGMRKNQRNAAQHIEIPASKISDTGIIDIALKDHNGKIRKLSDLKGKVVLLDFTLYNNEHSPARNLLLRELYNQYAQKGLEIYQISYDADPHYWMTVTDKLPWICTRDEQGLQSTNLSVYNIQNLPTLFVINRANELVARIDQIDELRAKLDALL